MENAKVITCDPQKPQCEAIAVLGERIQYVGSRQAVLQFKSAKTRVIDCRGKTLVPGFNDAHCHFFSGLRQLFSLDLSPAAVQSIPEIQSAIRRRVQSIPKGTWLSGTDYNEFYLAEKRHPTRSDLDAASPDHPLIITHRSLHACVLNSLAMRLVGLGNESEEPNGGLFDRDLESGEPNGLFYEMLPWIQKRIHSPLSREEYRWGIAELNRRNLELGITSFCDATATNNLAQFETFTGLIDEGLIQSRINLMLGHQQLAEYQKTPIVTGSGTPRLKIGSLKIVISEATGEMLPAQAELNRVVLAANQAGFQVAIHAVEKTSLAAAVTALEYVQTRQPVKDWRNRVEHCSECPPDLISRLARLKAVIVTQPPFLYYHGERYLHQVPPEIQPILYPFNSLRAAGLYVAGSSDSPVVPNNPLIGLYSAVCRRAQSGAVLLPLERLTAVQALEMYTLNAAYTIFEENEKGSLTAGKLADIVMLSDDPLSCPPESIRDLRVEMTLIAGCVVWENKHPIPKSNWP
jgi:predicted amidohydrolase YtcJ